MKRVEYNCGQHDIYDIYKGLFLNTIDRIMSNYFGFIQGHIIILSDIFERKLSQNKTLRKLTFTIYVGDSGEYRMKEYVDSQDGIDINTHDMGFVERYAEVCGYYKEDMRLGIIEVMSIENLESNSSLNTEDYLFMFKSMNITPSCEVDYSIACDCLEVSNIITMNVFLTEEDISMYKPGGVEAIRSEDNYNLLSLERNLDINITGLTDEEIKDRIDDNQ